MNKTKQNIYNHCITILDTKVKEASDLMAAASESANSELKSSAGDKFETGREMAIQELNKAGTQREQAIAMKSSLSKINIFQKISKGQIGSLIYTNNGIFFIAISLGNISLEGQNYFVISGNSPIASKFIGAEVGQTIEFNGNNYTITTIE